MNNFFVCPKCGVPIHNHEMNTCFQVKNQIPILIENYSQLESELAQLQDLKKAWYSDNQLGYLTGPYRHHVKLRLNYLKDLVSRYFKNSKDLRLLDIGCGDGFNLHWLREFFSNITASDYNFLRASRAQASGIASEVALADITQYPASNDSWDVVFFHHVLEHIPNDEKALSEVFRILKSGGHCILGVPNEGALWWRLAYQLEPHTKETTDHVHFYTLKSISRLCKSVGFEIVETKRLGYGVPHWTLDTLLRQYKFIHDALELIGSLFYPSQASSLYLLLRKP